MSSLKTLRKRLFIIDGYALLFRAHFALIRNPLITTYGLNTSALYGFVNNLLKLMRDENPDYFVCAFDSKGKTFRHKMYEDYKANRPEMPKELQLQLPHLWEILDAMNALKNAGIDEVHPRDVCKHYSVSTTSKDGRRISKTMQRMANDFEIYKGGKYGTYTLKQKINL